MSWSAICRIGTCALFLMLFGLADGAYAAKDDPCNAKFMDASGNLRPEKASAFLMHQQYDLYRKADTNCDGHLSASEVKAFENSQSVQNTLQLGEAYIKRTEASGEPIHLDKNGDPPIPIVADDSAAPGPGCGPGWQFLLRDSAEDVGPFSCPKDFKTASGAQFGYMWDGVSQNTSLNLKGIAAAVYTWQNDVPPARAGDPYVAWLSFAPSISFNRLTDTAAKQKSKDVDVLSLAATSEIGFANVLHATQYFRSRPAYNTDFEGRPHSWSETVEWQPVSNELGISAPRPLGTLLTWEVDPVARYQYTEGVRGSTDPIFANGGSVSRMGPVVGLTIAPVQNDAVVPHWLQSASFNASYEFLRDVTHGTDFRLFNAALNFPVDQSGHVGIKLAYENGQLETTGQQVRQATAGLSAKW